MFKEVPKNCHYHYGHVSSKFQDGHSSLKSQEQIIYSTRCAWKNICIEIGAAADTIKKWPVIQKVINQEFTENDLLFVNIIDRCNRNKREFLKLQNKLFKKKVNFIFLDLPYSNDSAVNRLIITNIVVISTVETERQKEWLIKN